MTKKGNKKAHISTLWRVEKYRFCNLLTKINIGIEYHVLDFLKHRSKTTRTILVDSGRFQTEGENEISNKALKAATKLKGCGQFLLFRNYYTINQIKLEKAHYCAQHLLCPMCAGVRAARSMKRYLDRIQELMRQNPRLKPVLITFTVKNGEDLDERFNHLIGSFRKLLDRYRDYRKKKKKWF